MGHDLVRSGQQLGGVEESPPDVCAAAAEPALHPRAPPGRASTAPPGMHYAESDSADAVTDAARVLRHVDAVWHGLSQ